MKSKRREKTVLCANVWLSWWTTWIQDRSTLRRIFPRHMPSSYTDHRLQPMCISVVFDHYLVLKSTQVLYPSLDSMSIALVSWTAWLSPSFQHVKGRPFKIAELNTVFNYFDLPACYRILKVIDCRISHFDANMRLYCAVRIRIFFSYLFQEFS